MSPAGKPKGLGGQPVVQPDGTVIVPFESLKGTIGSFRSTDGGATWSKEFQVSKIQFHGNSGGLRTSPLPSAEIDGARHRLRRVGGLPLRAEVLGQRHRLQPLERRRQLERRSRGSRSMPVGSGVDHFVPGLAVDPATSGASAHLALTYYYYPNAACTPATCQLDVGYISSPDGGAHWSAPTQLAGPMSLADIAATSQGPMVGDYISTSFNAAGTAATVFAVGKPRTPAAGVRRGHVGAVRPRWPWPAARRPRRGGHRRAGRQGPGVGEAQHAVRDD